MSRGLPLNVKLCLDKALDSALLSVETYNKPAVKFKSGWVHCFNVYRMDIIVSCNIFQKGIKPFYREKK